MPSPLVLELNAVIVSVTGASLRILTLEGPEPELGTTPPEADRRRDRLPSGPLDPGSDRTLELGLRRWVREQAGIELGYVEQLYTFGDQYRDPREQAGGPRLISVPYLALVRETPVPRIGGARWWDVYDYFPWEQRAGGRAAAVAQEIAPVLQEWARAAPTGTPGRERRERCEIAFGLGGSVWDEERVLERYELLYEVGLVQESGPRETPKGGPSQTGREPLGRPMALDHRRILATALGRLRGKIKYRPVVFELLPACFTLLQLQQVVETLAGVSIHKTNFRRLVEKGGLVEPVEGLKARTGGRPAKLFQFRREVLRERPAPGVGLPGIPGSSKDPSREQPT